MFDLTSASPAPDAISAIHAGSHGSPARRLIAVRGFPFAVTASPAARRAARRLAKRVAAAADLLHGALGVAPHLELRVLDRAGWLRYADVPAYGVPHVADGALVVGAEPADEWHAISDYFARHLAAPELARLCAVHGIDAVNRRGPALTALAEALLAHEVAHLLALQRGLRFPRRWLEEAFANYALVAVLGETDPAALRLVGSLAEAAATLAGGMPTLETFERDFGDMDVVSSVLAELAITRGVYAAYAAERTAPLARLFVAFDTTRSPRDADYELGRMLAERVHPALSAIPSKFAAPHVDRAA
jgi:hypothetical protein